MAGPNSANRDPPTVPRTTAAATALARKGVATSNVGTNLTFAQSGHRMPTGAWTMHRGQTGVSHLPHRSLVGVAECLAQYVVAETSGRLLIVGVGPSFGPVTLFGDVSVPERPVCHDPEHGRAGRQRFPVGG